MSRLIKYQCDVGGTMTMFVTMGVDISIYGGGNNVSLKITAFNLFFLLHASCSSKWEPGISVIFDSVCTIDHNLSYTVDPMTIIIMWDKMNHPNHFKIPNMNDHPESDQKHNLKHYSISTHFFFVGSPC